MRKIILISSIVFLSLFITGCSKDENNEDEASPEDRFRTYVEEWGNTDFTKMYDFISEEATKEYATEDVVDRYENIYEEIEVQDLDISYVSLDEDALDEAIENDEAKIDFSVDMDTIGGPIAFDYTATLIKEGETEEDDGDWFIDWDPGFIFPELKDGGEVKVEKLIPERGNIYDRNDEPLAVNDTVLEIGVVPEQMDEETSKKKMADLLEIDEETIDSKLDQGWVEPGSYVPVRKVQDASEELLDELEEIKGVSTDGVPGRVYPAKEAAAHLIGYIGEIQADDLEELEEEQPGVYSADDMIGRMGLEKHYEKELRGTNGFHVYVDYDNKNDEENETKENTTLAETSKQDGKDITITVDVDVQEEIYKSYGDDAGTAAAINPQSGEILALFSSPFFNPNEQLYGMSTEKEEKIYNDEDEPFLNRIEATFAPGSSIKPITAAIGLENGSIDPDEKIQIEGREWSNGESWGDYTVKRVSGSNEEVDLKDALIESDNIYFARQAIKMGGDEFVEGLKKFGFEEDLSFGYPLYNSTISSDGSLDDEVLLANAGYGQGEIQISALHLAAAYTTFINDGNMLKPTLLNDEETEDIWEKHLITADEASMIRDDLRQVVEASNGTAKKALEADFPISGKTGTAELKRSGEDSGQENGWFVGYPSDDQDILIAMMVEHTEDEGGSSYTVEKVTDILQELKK